MIKKITLLTLIFSTIGVFSQIPTGYYDSATGTGFVLKTQLFKIINNNNDGLATEYLSIDKGYSYLYTTYQNSDTDNLYENNNTVLDMYSEQPGGADAYEYIHITDKDNGTLGSNEGDWYNREHLIPQSIFGSASPMKNDAHFVVPSDKHVNGVRSNYPFGVVDTPTFTSTNGSKLGNNLNSGYSAGYTGTVFEPIDEFKGDIARMHFYFATRYEDQVAGWSYTMFNGTSDDVFTQTFFNILYQWHLQDPVSQREIDRNNAIYNEQNNRNPFIDHPEWVYSVWGATLDINDYVASDFNIHPNPTYSSTVYINKGNAKVSLLELYSITGKLVLSKKITDNKPTITLDHLDTIASGIYLLKIQTNVNTIVKKLVIN